MTSHAPEVPPVKRLRFVDLLRRLFTTVYKPAPEERGFLERAQTQESDQARVTVAVLDSREAARVFGVPIAARQQQAVHIRVENRSDAAMRLHVVGLDRDYYTPLEAAAANHFSYVRRLTAFGVLGWVFLELLLLAPSKLITAWRANRRIDRCFQSLGFKLRPIDPGTSAEGFVFTPLDLGTKEVRIRLLMAGGRALQAAPQTAGTAAAPPGIVEFHFTAAVAGIAADHVEHDFESLHPPESRVACDVPTLVAKLREMPRSTTDRKGTGAGDPVNLIVIGTFDTLLSAFAARWDETETITLASCWRTAKAFLLGSEYRYSPVSALFLFGRGQDVALQRIRRSINQRLHLRLWLTPLTLNGQPVWVGQVSRDIGVRFTTKAWNLTTHRIDPDVDESRDYVVKDLLEAERLESVGYVDGVGACEPSEPRRNLTGDPFYTDGLRAAILLSPTRTPPRFISWG